MQQDLNRIHVKLDQMDKKLSCLVSAESRNSELRETGVTVLANSTFVILEELPAHTSTTQWN